MQFSSRVLYSRYRPILLRRTSGVNWSLCETLPENEAWKAEKFFPLEQQKPVHDAGVRSPIPASVSEAKCYFFTFEERPEEIHDVKPGQSYIAYRSNDVQKLISNEYMKDSNIELSTVRDADGHCSWSTDCWSRVKFLGNIEKSGTSNGRILSVVQLQRRHYSSMPALSTVSKRKSPLKSRRSPIIDNDSKIKGIPSDRSAIRRRRIHSREKDSSGDDDTDDSDDKEARQGSHRKVLGSNGYDSLGKYAMTTRKRVPLKFLEAEDVLSQQVEAIRKEVTQRRKMKETDVQDSVKQPHRCAKRFDECNLSPLTVRAVTEAGYVQMTRVQEETLSVYLDGKDAIVKARAATGKSIAFLLPAIETVVKASSSTMDQRIPPIYVLILCPTRELATQVAAEANVLLKHHSIIGLQTLVGGTRLKEDQRRLEAGPCHILVATPGRLLDHIENKSSISSRLMGLQMLILDEADHLLDLGFRKDIQKILDCLPRKRQSFLFSAIVPKEVRRISQLVLKRECVYVDTVGLGSPETSSMVKQFYLVASHNKHFEIVHSILKKHISEVLDYKVVVFCTTAMVTSLLYSVFHDMRLNVREIHSKKPALYRSRVSDEFRDSKRLILITSDVSARGMNYPDVTLVIQVGVPSDRDQYIHRLGRAGRGGKEGEGILVLAAWELYFLNDLMDLPLEQLPSPNSDPDSNAKMVESMKRVDASLKEAAYHAWLGYYNSIHAVSRDKATLVEAANCFAASIGLEKPPVLFRKTALKMGLKDVPGIQLHR